MHHADLHQHHHHHAGRQVHQEVVEAEVRRGADQDVRRIANQRRGAAEIGRLHLGEQERKRRNVQAPADRDRYRGDQQYGGDVVQQRGQQGGDQRQGNQQAGRRGAGKLHRANRQVLEHAGAAGDRHQHHHPGQQADGVEVDALDRLLLGQHPAQHHRAAAEQGEDGAVEAVHRHQGVGDRQDRQSDIDRRQAYRHRSVHDTVEARGSIGRPGAARPPHERAATWWQPGGRPGRGGGPMERASPAWPRGGKPRITRRDPAPAGHRRGIAYPSAAPSGGQFDQCTNSQNFLAPGCSRTPSCSVFSATALKSMFFRCGKTSMRYCRWS